MYKRQDHSDANPHIWVSISNCMKQVRNIADGLIEADPEDAVALEENTQEYLAKLSDLRGRMHEALDDLPNRDIITFHEAFPYFAEEFDLHIVKVVNREPDSQPSAKELADTCLLYTSNNSSIFILNIVSFEFCDIFIQLIYRIRAVAIVVSHRTFQLK